MVHLESAGGGRPGEEFVIEKYPAVFLWSHIIRKSWEVQLIFVLIDSM